MYGGASLAQFIIPVAQLQFQTRVLESKHLMNTGKVNDDVIQIDTHEGDETFALDPTQESELLAAIAEAERGELISASELLQKIRRS